MPLPGKKPPDDFVCLHRNYCPHLEGLSTGWVWEEYQRSGHREREDAQSIRQLEDELEQAEQRILALETDNDGLKAKLAALHKSRFKRKKKASCEPDPQAAKDSSDGIATSTSEPKRPRGAPKGHPGWSRHKPDHVDKTVDVPAPSVCPDCGGEHLTAIDERTEHLQEDVVLQPRTVVTRFNHAQAVCGDCGHTVVQAAPGELLNCPIGPLTKAACVFLRNGTGMSYRKVQDIMQVLFGMRFVPASAMAFDRKATQAAEPIYDVLLDKLRSAAVAFGDETFWRENGMPAYVWYGGNEDVAVYHIVPSRSGDVAAHLFGDHFPGVLHTDGYAGYNATNTKHRQTCLGHLIAKTKELSAQLDLMSPALRDSRSVHFCQTIKAFFKLTCSIANRFRSGHIARGKVPVFLARLTSTLKTLCASPCGFDGAENLRARLIDPKREYPRLFTFLHHEGVHPTNNHSEQSLRWLVIFRKLCFGTRTPAGSRSLSVLASLIVTGRRHGAHPLDITAALFIRTAPQTLSIIFDPAATPHSILNKSPP